MPHYADWIAPLLHFIGSLQLSISGEIYSLWEGSILLAFLHELSHVFPTYRNFSNFGIPEINIPEMYIELYKIVNLYDIHFHKKMLYTVALRQHLINSYWLGNRWKEIIPYFLIFIFLLYEFPRS